MDIKSCYTQLITEIADNRETHSDENIYHLNVDLSETTCSCKIEMSPNNCLLMVVVVIFLKIAFNHFLSKPSDSIWCHDIKMVLHLGIFFLTLRSIVCKAFYHPVIWVFWVMSLGIPVMIHLSCHVVIWPLTWSSVHCSSRQHKDL